LEAKRFSELSKPELIREIKRMDYRISTITSEKYTCPDPAEHQIELAALTRLRDEARVIRNNMEQSAHEEASETLQSRMRSPYSTYNSM